jgi:hypothetical protein
LRNLIFCFRLIVILFSLAAVPAFALEGSFAFQGGLVGAFQANGKPLDPNVGVNGYAYFDLKLLPSVSVGIGSSFTSLSNNEKRIYLDGTHLLGRFTPFAESSWNPYLMAGFGFRPFREIDPDHRWWPGNYQALAGIGVRHPLFKGIDLDMTAFYNINSPDGVQLNSLGARAGLAFPFGGDDSDKPKEKKVAAHMTIDGSAYQIQKGDTLWSIGKRSTGRGAKWKDVYDVNKETIQDPNLIYPKQDLVLPRDSKMNLDSQDKKDQ